MGVNTHKKSHQHPVALKIDLNNNAVLDDCDCDGCGDGNPWVSAHISYANNTQSTKNVSRIKDIG